MASQAQTEHQQKESADTSASQSSAGAFFKSFDSEEAARQKVRIPQNLKGYGLLWPSYRADINSWRFIGFSDFGSSPGG